MSAQRRKPVSQHEKENEAWSGGYSLPALYSDLVILGILVGVVTVILFSFSSLRGNTTVWGIFLALAGGCALVLGGIYLYRRYSRWYVVTNERLIHREGLFVRRHHVLELIRIDDVTFEQGPIEAIFGCGTIFVSSSDTSHPELEIRGIEEVQQVADLIDTLRREERKQRGFHVESI